MLAAGLQAGGTAASVESNPNEGDLRMRIFDDMGLTKVTDLGHFIRDQRRTARLSLRKMSQMAGISNPYLSQIERGLRRPSAEILQAIAKALRISAETLYVKAGILEEREGENIDPVTAILRDLTITDKQKQVMIEIYQSFRHENELEGRKNASERPLPKRAVALEKTKKASGAKKPATEEQPNEVDA
jgi:transcriptional regulator with XRE-family HTH domain